MSAVCHHGGAGTTAAGLRAGKPTIIVPFFGDQFFWGNVIEKMVLVLVHYLENDITADELVEAFKFVHEPETRVLLNVFVMLFQKKMDVKQQYMHFMLIYLLSRMRSDLESTFAACYRLEEYNLQISRPVAQVLVAAGALEESQFRLHATREWQSIHDNRIHIPTMVL